MGFTGVRSGGVNVESCAAAAVSGCNLGLQHAGCNLTHAEEVALAFCMGCRSLLDSICACRPASSACGNCCRVLRGVTAAASSKLLRIDCQVHACVQFKAETVVHMLCM